LTFVGDEVRDKLPCQKGKDKSPDRGQQALYTIVKRSKSDITKAESEKKKKLRGGGRTEGAHGFSEESGPGRRGVR